MMDDFEDAGMCEICGGEYSFDSDMGVFVCKECGSAHEDFSYLDDQSGW